MKRGMFLIIVLFTSFLGLGYTVPGNCQQSPETIQAPEVQKPSAKSPRRQAIGLKVVADLSVSPLTYTGTCPATFIFKGRISVNRPTTVVYKFIRSDGVHTEVKQLTFEKAGRQDVTMTWEFDDPGASTFKGVVVMQVIAPVNVKIESNPVVFSGTCTNHMPESRKP